MVYCFVSNTIVALRVARRAITAMCTVAIIVWVAVENAGAVNAGIVNIMGIMNGCVGWIWSIVSMMSILDVTRILDIVGMMRVGNCSIVEAMRIRDVVMMSDTGIAYATSSDR